jgi:glucose-1-phosphate thymidylyltransferase
MKGLILAGGSGSRLRPITHTSSKQLVPVANKPILFYGLEHMVAAGVEEFGIVIGDGPSADEIREAVGDGSRWGVSVTYIPQDAPLGLGHCVLIAREFLGDDDFIMYLGDNMIQQGVAGFVDRFEADRDRSRTPTLEGPVVPPSAQILLCPVPDPQRFGVAAVDEEGHVVRLVEKPADPPSNLALCGVYLFTPAIHEAVRAIEPSERGELEITDAIQWLIDQGHRVRHDVLEGWWLDTGKKDPLLESNRRVLEVIEPRCDGKVDEDSVIDGRVVIEEGAELVASTVRGPAVIGARTRLVNSYVGPYTAIGDDCEVVGSEVEQSVVLDHSRIIGVPRLSDSLVGRYVEVLRSDRRPKATRLMVGDHCTIELD